MNKLLLTFLSILLLILLAVTGILFYAFSPSGNNMFKSYIKDELETNIGLPVEVDKFTLDVGKASLVVSINKQANVEIVTHYDLLTQSVNGIYRVKAKNFQYENMVLRQADLRGSFSGVAEDIVVDGKGTALDAPLVYSLRVLEKLPKNIVASMKGVSLSEMLELAGEAPLAQGKIDVDINMPDIGEEFAKGYGSVVLHKALFNAKIVEKMYHLRLPKESYMSGKVDAQLKGNRLDLLVNAQSNLFLLKIEDASIGMNDKKVHASYDMDVKEMAILTQNKLAGPLKIVGKVELENEKIHLEGATHSLGGRLLFDIAETSKFHFENLELSKILTLTKQPAYAKGLLSGSGDIDKAFNSGRYDVQIAKGQFGAKSIEKSFGYQIPAVNNFTFESTGKVAQKMLDAEVTLASSLSDIKFTDLVYDIENKKLNTAYDLFLPNIGLLMPNNKAVKRGYLSAKGKLNFDKTLQVKGSAKGLGEKLDFTYDGKTANVDARNLFVEKLLSLSALPRYVKGKLSSNVKISNIDTLDGTFTLRGDELVTQPNAMKKLIDKKLDMKIALESKGKLNKGVAYANTKVNTSMGKFNFKDTVYHTKTGTFKSKYVADIPDLQKTYTLTGQKLHGPLRLAGEISQDKLLKVTGQTTSLGGKVNYTLLGDTLKANIEKVPVEKILGLLGNDKLVQGDAYGTVNHNLKTKVGVINLDIKSFQIKASGATNTVKMFIGKDPARIIYTSTKLIAKINGDVTRYTLTAKGSRSTIEVTEGKLDKVNDRHTAKFKFVYEKYVVTGSIAGTVDHPSVIVDPSSVMQSKTGEKIQKELDKALGGDMGKAVGGFLKGMKF